MFVISVSIVVLEPTLPHTLSLFAESDASREEMKVPRVFGSGSRVHVPEVTSRVGIWERSGIEMKDRQDAIFEIRASAVCRRQILLCRNT